MINFKKNIDALPINVFSFIESTGVWRRGIGSGIFLGATSTDVFHFLRKTSSLNHVEFHNDETLRFLDVCLDEGLTFSYHSNFPNEFYAELDLMEKMIGRGCKRVIVHPNSVKHTALRPYEQYVAWENLDLRNNQYRTASEMKQLLEKYPQSSICLDIGHLWDIPDEIDNFISLCKGRIGQLHVSETCRTTGTHKDLVSPEFATWAREKIALIPNVTLVGEPSLHTKITNF